MSGLGTITNNEAARTNWVYIKSLTASASFKLKTRLDFNTETQKFHHEAGKAQIAALVDNAVQCMDKNPFSGKNQDILVNVSIGEIANADVKSHLSAIKE